MISTAENTTVADYSYWGAGFNEPPSHLLTKNLLKERGLKPAPGQSPAGRIWLKKRGVYILLYDEATAVAVLPPTEAQKASRERAMLTRHTCKTCGQVKKYSLVTEPDHSCQECQDKARLAAVAQQARDLLADPDKVCILDTETTGLYSPFVIQIAIIDGRGQVLLNTKVKLEPGQEIESGATEVHGMTGADLTDAPNWREIWPTLRAACRGRTVVTYNLEFDIDAISYTCRTCGIEKIGLGRVGFCAMELYAEFVGEPYKFDWHGHIESYKFQPLPGGDHNALGDCQATIAILHEMAAQTMLLCNQSG